MSRPEARRVDLRSDTVTCPTDRMRAAMAAAEVGDDGYGEDPTVRRLEALAAERTGMEAGLYLPTGTMANLCALLAHLEAGAAAGRAAVIHEEHAHLFAGDRGLTAVQLGAVSVPVAGDWGVLQPAALAAALGDHPQPALVCIENTHNQAGGAALTPAHVEATAQQARAAGAGVHIDGARLFNAAAAQQLDATALTRHADTVMFCASKGLSAPVGSLVCGRRELVDAACRHRKRLGGSMRQAGVIAAAAIVALEEMVERLAEDAARAAALADALAAVPGLAVAQPPIPTNFVTADVAGLGWTGEQLVARWAEVGVLAGARPPHRARLVVNRHVDDADIRYVAEATAAMVESARRPAGASAGSAPAGLAPTGAASAGSASAGSRSGAPTTRAGDR